MRSLRTTSTRRLLAVIVSVLGIGVAGTALALAASGGGPVPPRKPLAGAVRDALTAKPVPGVTARIAFRNQLIDSASVQGTDPLLSGATGRLWIGAGDRLRLELQSSGGDVQIVSDGRTLSVFDAASNTAYRVKLPAAERRSAQRERVPTVAAIKRMLNRVMRHANVSGATPGDVGGKPAYTVRLSPRRHPGLLGRAELAWDAANGVPLRAAVYARNSTAPVLELKATKIAFGPVSASTFAVHPPASAKTTTLDAPARGHAGTGRGGRPATGLAAAARRAPFRLSAPATLAGRPRTAVRALSGKPGHTAVLIAYGTGLDTIAVVERAATGRGPATAPRGEGPGLTLPKVAIAGASGHQLVTALGTAVIFERGGVAYVVAGSVPAAVARAAARGL